MSLSDEGYPFSERVKKGKTAATDVLSPRLSQFRFLRHLWGNRDNLELVFARFKSVELEIFQLLQVIYEGEERLIADNMKQVQETGKNLSL